MQTILGKRYSPHIPHKASSNHYSRSSLAGAHCRIVPVRKYQGFLWSVQKGRGNKQGKKKMAIKSDNREALKQMRTVHNLPANRWEVPLGRAEKDVRATLQLLFAQRHSFISAILNSSFPQPSPLPLQYQTRWQGIFTTVSTSHLSESTWMKLDTAMQDHYLTGRIPVLAVQNFQFQDPWVDSLLALDTW